LVFEGIDGDFALESGDTLRFRWSEGFIFLNGKRHQPPPTREEYEEWRPHTKASLAPYREVPYIQQRVRILGNDDAGWRTAYTEWDSLKSVLSRQVFSRYVATHDKASCVTAILEKDAREHRIVEWARENPSGVEVRWKGNPLEGGELLLLNAQTNAPGSDPTPRAPRLVTREEALSTLEMLKGSLEGEAATTVYLKFGGFEKWGAHLDPRKQTK
jgi:hypothetical protein